MFDGSSIAGTTPLTISATSHWSMKGTIIRTGSTTARATVTFYIPNSPDKVYVQNASMTSKDFTTTNILKITATAAGGGASTGDILGHLWLVNYQQ
jgi:hypothetical protein